MNSTAPSSSGRLNNDPSLPAKSSATDEKGMTLTEKIVAGLLIGLSIVLVVVFTVVAVTGEPTPLEATALQFVSIASGLGGSYLFGRQASRKVAQAHLRPHLRSSFRRLVSQSFGLSRCANIAAQCGPGDEEKTLAIISEVLALQIVAAGDALADWEELDPDAVAELKESIEEKRKALG